MKTLVIGFPGTGKTTYCKEHLGNGICYDLDAITSALRLGKDHTTEAFIMANDFFYGFALKAEEYADDVFIIRTAPSIEELETVEPDRVVLCSTVYGDREIRNRDILTERIEKAIQWCKKNNVPILHG